MGNHRAFQSRAAGSVLFVFALFEFFLLCGCSGGGGETINGNYKLLNRTRLCESQRTMPVIDIHMHTFNTTMLPLDGIVLGKRDKLWVASFLDDENARCVAEYLTRVTDLTEQEAVKPVEGRKNPQEIDREALQATAMRYGHRVSSIEQNPLIQAVRYAYLTGCDDEAGALRVCTSETESRKKLKEFSRSQFPVEARSGFVEFVEALTQPAALLPRAYYEEFEKGSDARSQFERGLVVSHSMDLGPVYNQQPSPGVLLDFETQQIGVYREQVENAGGGLAYFVAYNPFREHWPIAKASRSGEALRIVRDAIENHGAFGVKFYPPSGYRPTSNTIPGKPNTLFTGFPNRQWEARYRKLTLVEGQNGKPDTHRIHPVSGEDLDELTGQLLDWCIARDIPVFAHCNTGEFEARYNYGLRNADPAYWEEFLISRSTPGKPCTLRLCLGHAGGSSFWFGDHGGDSIAQKRWGETVYRLCTTYPNVYCEIGVHGQIGEEQYRSHFIEKLEQLFRESQARIDAGEHAYPFAKKVMYGSDWFMPSGMTLEYYLDAYQRAFIDPRLEDNYPDFFLGNALGYLNAQAAIDRESLDEDLRMRLRALLAEWERIEAQRSQPVGTAAR